MWRDNLRGIFYIAMKDMRTYYLKPPSISWGTVFPIAWIMAFYLRNPQNFAELVPGLIAMTALFSTTAAEAVVINFELRLGTLERLLLAPIGLSAVLLGKITGGAIFGLIMTAIVTLSSVFILGLHPDIFLLLLILIPSLFVFSSLGALLCVLVKEVFEAQTLLNLPRFVMIFLCGVVYPISKMPDVLKCLAYALPLTYTVNGLRQAFQSISQSNALFIDFFTIDFLVLVCLSVLFTLAAIKMLSKRVE
ncbi:ABC transporter permease [Methanophagales archaeon]|nr:MAG: ABC transporter permease [Methanophagales archaeon]